MDFDRINVFYRMISSWFWVIYLYTVRKTNEHMLIAAAQMFQIGALKQRGKFIATKQQTSGSSSSSSNIVKTARGKSSIESNKLHFEHYCSHRIYLLCCL